MEQNNAFSAVKLAWLVIFAIGATVLWLMWRPTAPTPEPPQLAAYHARQEVACTVATDAQAKLRAKGLEQQAQKLDVGSVCDPGRGLRHGFYWVLGVAAVLGLVVMLGFAASPRF